MDFPTPPFHCTIAIMAIYTVYRIRGASIKYLALSLPVVHTAYMVYMVSTTPDCIPPWELLRLTSARTHVCLPNERTHGTIGEPV